MKLMVKNRFCVMAAWIFLLLMIFQLGSAYAGQSEPVMISIKRLSLETVLRIAKAAIEQCRKEGVQVAVTVVDRSGQAQIMLKDTLAMDIAAPISRNKAYTAMAFGTPTSALQDRFPGAYGVPKMDDLMVSPGAVPIMAAGNILGGIGVSGAPSGLTDEICAKAGLEAVMEDLEMN